MLIPLRKLLLWTVPLLLLGLAACQSPSAAQDSPEPPTLQPLAEPTPADPGDSDPAQIAPVAAQEQTDRSSPTPASVTGSYPAPATAAPATTVQPDSYPGPATATVAGAGEESAPQTGDVYLPVTGGGPSATSTPAADAGPTPAPSPTPVPTVDFAAVNAELQNSGQALGFVKLGLHTTIFEDRDILDEWMQQLDAAGVPFFIKTVDNAEPLYRAQQLMKESGVPHTLVFRATGSVPHYELPAAQAAQIHWEFHKEKFPPELDKSIVWVETLNEPDRTKAEWLGQFALETARLAAADGFRWAAFGFAAGEPEPEQWQTPSMLAFLQLAGENPEQLAIALHEYSYTDDEIEHEYPYKVGRFQELFRIADERGFPRPTVLFTEWGWEHNDIPPVEEALSDLRWAAKLYANYPQVKGAAIWNLGAGCCFGDVSEEVQGLIAPLTEFSLTKYYAISQTAAQDPVDPLRFQP